MNGWWFSWVSNPEDAAFEAAAFANYTTEPWSASCLDYLALQDMARSAEASGFQQALSFRLGYAVQSQIVRVRPDLWRL